jgi:hypothetical protein
VPVEEPSTASNSEVGMLNREFGFALNNGHRRPSLSGPKSAMCGRLRVGKSCRLGQCSHVFGL